MAELNLKETLDRHHSNVNAETNNEPQLDVQTCLSQVITRIKITIQTIFQSQKMYLSQLIIHMKIMILTMYHSQKMCLSQVIIHMKIMILTMFILEIFLLVIMRSMI